MANYQFYITIRLKNKQTKTQSITKQTYYHHCIRRYVSISSGVQIYVVPLAEDWTWMTAGVDDGTIC